MLTISVKSDIKLVIKLWEILAMGTKTRMAAPDIIKIAATIFVILIHHKKNYSPLTMVQHNLFFIIVSGCLLALAAFLFCRELKAGSSKTRCIYSLILPIIASLSILFFRRFAVGIFLMMSGYLMTGSLDRADRPFAIWYTFRNLASRIVRFYLPLIPVFILALLYKIFVLEYEYSLIEVVVRFFLGGFKPGGYYVAILVQLVLLFPIIHSIVRKYKFKGVMLCFAFTLIYDVLSTSFGMHETLYKFLIFRLTAHIAFGVYLKYSDFKKERGQNLFMFTIGLIYVICCVFTDTYIPTIFFRWRDVSVATAFFLYPAIAWFISEFGCLKYTDSRLSCHTISFANATYHIFLVQLLYFTTVGFPLNEYINNAVITLGLNVLITVPLGIFYFKRMNPIESKIISKIKS